MRSVRWVCCVLRESGVSIANRRVVAGLCSTIGKNSVFTFRNLNPFCSCQPTPSTTLTVRSAGVGVPAECCCKVDLWFVGYVHLLTYPLLAEALVLLVPEVVLLRYVGMLAVAAEATTMFARVVFVGVTAALGLQSSPVSVSVRFTVCCCVAGSVACDAARLTCQGFTVGLGSVGSTVVIVDGLLLEQGGQVGDLVGDGVGGTRGWQRGFIEFVDTVLSGEFS